MQIKPQSAITLNTNNLSIREANRGFANLSNADSRLSASLVALNTSCASAISALNASTVSTISALAAGNYAGMYLADGTTAQAIPTGSSYTKITRFVSNGAFNVASPMASGNSLIRLKTTGKYLVTGSFSFTAGTNNVTFRCTIFKGGVEQNNVHWLRKISTGADAGNAGFTGIINVTAVPTDVDVRIRHDYMASVNFTPVYMNLTIHKMGT